MPAGTKTAPALTGTPTGRAITLYFIDASGDKWAQRLIVALSATLAAINAWIVLYQAITQSSIYAVTDELLWQGAELASNAQFGPRSGKEDGVNLGFVNNTTMVRTSVRVIAPVEDIMQDALDIPVPTQADLADFITNTETLLTPAVFVDAQYTARRERRNNPRVQ